MRTAATILAGTVALIALMAMALLTGAVGMYSDVNSGVYLRHVGGYELTGTPGWFHCAAEC